MSGHVKTIYLMYCTNTDEMFVKGFSTADSTPSTSKYSTSSSKYSTRSSTPRSNMLQHPTPQQQQLCPTSQLQQLQNPTPQQQQLTQQPRANSRQLDHIEDCNFAGQRFNPYSQVSILQHITDLKPGGNQEQHYKEPSQHGTTQNQRTADSSLMRANAEFKPNKFYWSNYKVSRIYTYIHDVSITL